MAQSAEKFAQMLSQGIHRIRLHENKTVSIVQDEMGYALGRKGGSAVERWRKGYLPPKVEDIEKLAKMLAHRGHFERDWIEAFLDSAGYPQAEAFCDELFSTAVSSPQTAIAVPSPPAQPISVSPRVSPGLMASVSLMVLVALIWSWAQSTAVVPPQPTLPIFPTNQYGILFLGVPTGDDTEALIANALQAELAATGLSDEVQLHTYPVQEPSLTALRAHSKADLAVSVQITAVAFTPHISLNRPSPALQAIADALSAPIPADSSLAASEVVANRLVVLANAALGYDALHNGEYERCARRFSAVLMYTDKLAIDFTRAEASHVATAVCLEALGQAEEARNHYEAAITINPNFAQGHFGLGNYWYSQRDLEKAQGFYEQTAVLAATDPLATDEVTARAYAGLGNIALAQERPTAARDAFTQAIAYDDTHPAYFFARAAAHRTLGDSTAAATDLLTCLDLAQTAESDPSAYLQQVATDCRVALNAIQATATATATTTATTATTTPTHTLAPTGTATSTTVPSATATPLVAATQVLPPPLPPQLTATFVPATAVPPAPTDTPRPRPTLTHTPQPPSSTPMPTDMATAVATNTFTPTPMLPTSTPIPPTPTFTPTSLPPTIPPSLTPTPITPTDTPTPLPPTVTLPPTIPPTGTPTVVP